MIYSFKYIVVH